MSFRFLTYFEGESRPGDISYSGKIGVTNPVYKKDHQKYQLKGLASEKDGNLRR